MRLDYTRYEMSPSPAESRPYVYRPMLTVKVRGTKGEVPIAGLLDTGAVDCILPWQVADQVAPSWVAGTAVITGATGGERELPYGAVLLSVDLDKGPETWPAIVAFDHEREFRALWGMAHFLDRFRMTFDGPGRHFTIRRPK